MLLTKRRPTSMPDRGRFVAGDRGGVARCGARPGSGSRARSHADPRELARTGPGARGRPCSGAREGRP